MKKFIKEIPRGIWVFFIGAVFGALAIGLFWIASRSETSQPHQGIMLTGNTYTVIYNGKTRTPTWTLQALSSNILNPQTEQERYPFHPNPLIPKNIQSEVSDYQESGFDIGLLIIPTTLDAIEKTFSLSFAAPQDPQLKNSYWKKIEQYIVDLTKEQHIVVISGPLYLDEEKENGKNFVKYQVIGNNKVGVPSHFFKVIYTSKIENPEIYILPNKDIAEEISLQSFQTSEEHFEKVSGIMLPENIAPYFPTVSAPTIK